MDRPFPLHSSRRSLSIQTTSSLSLTPKQRMATLYEECVDTSGEDSSNLLVVSIQSASEMFVGTVEVIEIFERIDAVKKGLRIL